MAQRRRLGDKFAPGASHPQPTTNRLKKARQTDLVGLARIVGAVKIIANGVEWMGVLGQMFTCTCSWTLITQEGEEDLKMHIKIHMADAHPGTEMSDEDVRKAIKTV
jgi:predicted small metal-binding protein